MILDMIFGTGNYKNEIIWQRTNSHNSANQYGRVHDVIFFYAKTQSYCWNLVSTEYSQEQLKRYRRDETGRLYTCQDLTASRPDSSSGKFEWRGTMPTSTRGWGYTLEKLEEWWNEGKIITRKDGTPRMDGLKVYLDQMPGKPIQSIWIDIPRISNTSTERLGYPTQKPIVLLERIIQASSNHGDVILDPFCGCGTAVHAAQKLGRIWVGIDITPLATALIKSRLYDAFKIEAKKDYDLIGEPTTLSDAKHLANQDRYQFQWWALGLIPARPYGGQAGSKTGKKGADKGIDGVMTFSDSTNDTDKRIIIQVKSGKVKSSDIRDLNGTVDREKNAVMGIFITLEPPSRNMELEAMEIGYYHSEGFNRDYPKIQLLTIEQLLAGEKVKFPGTDTTLKQAQREYIEVKQRDLL